MGLGVVPQVNVESGPKVGLFEVTILIASVVTHEIIGERDGLPPMRVENALLNSGVREKEGVDKTLRVHRDNWKVSTKRNRRYLVKHFQPSKTFEERTGCRKSSDGPFHRSKILYAISGLRLLVQ